MAGPKEKGAEYVIRTLRKAGYPAYLVGGCVRDHFLNRRIFDYDITTSAKPEVVQHLFPKTIPTGIRHGTITVLHEGAFYEVTTFRTESTYSDHRHPDGVNFVQDVSEDLKRRDFTINAMAYDPLGDELLDLFQGQRDLQNQTIRTVGDPRARFEEDALRILRAVRFAAQLNFNIEPATFLAMAQCAPLLKKVAVERIFAELSKLLLSDHPATGVNLMLDAGLLAVILPELLPMASFRQFNRYHDKTVFFHTMEVLNNTRSFLPLRLAALFHDSGKPHTFTVDEEGNGHFYGHENISAKLAEEALTRLKTDNKTRELTVHLIEKHMVSPNMKKELKLKNLINEFGVDEIHLLFELKQADRSGKPDIHGSRNPDSLQGRIQEILDRGDPLTLEDLAISGKDLIKEGMKPGPIIGEILHSLLQDVLTDPSLNDYDILLERARMWRNKKND